MNRLTIACILTSSVLLTGELARAQCPEWTPGFGTAGPDELVSGLTVFDDGSGAALYACGIFQSVDGLYSKYVARWEGTQWSALGAGIDSPANNGVATLVGFDDGTGPALYAAGDFTLIGGHHVNNVAKWDGAAWTPLASGISAHAFAMTVYDDGTGPALYVGGEFTAAGGAPAANIAKWNGSSWSPVGSGLGGIVFSLAVFDDGTGPALYAAGTFLVAGGVPANRIARWNGSTWSAVGTGMNNLVADLVVHDDGTGTKLYASGVFTTAGGSSANLIARWDGVSWTGMNTGMNQIFSLASYDDGSGAKLYAGGFSQLKRWDGANWSTVGALKAFAMAGFDEGAGPRLFVGGDFTQIGSTPVNRIARWDGVSWTAVSNAQTAGFDDNIVEDLAVADLGSGPALYAAGYFTTSGGVPVNHVARYDGTSWSPLGSGTGSRALALTAFDDGSGPALYAGGIFGTAGGVLASRVAKWDGSSWSALGSGVNSDVDALIGFDDGNGPALYAAGLFTTAGGAPANHIAKWSGGAWSPLGSGITGNSAEVYALAVFDDGTGPALFAGGLFDTAGGVPASGIARWDGTTWSSVGGAGTTLGQIYALIAFDDGTGLALYAGGAFSKIVGVSTTNLAKWNGTNWASFSGVGQVIDMAVFDEGTGPALYVTGSFTNLGGSRNVARWSGTSWSGLGQGLLPPGSGGSLDFGRAAEVYDDGSGTGPAIYFGGSFSLASNVPSKNIARWQGCNHPGERLCAGDGSGAACPCANSGAVGHGCDNSAATGGASLTSAGWTSLAHDSLVLTSSDELASVLSIFLQGDHVIAATNFGDGLRCAGGALKRLFVKNAMSGVVSAPQPGDLSISSRSAALGDAIAVGETRVYQVYYRDPNLAFCAAPTGNSWNVSSGLRIAWLP